MKSDGRLFNLYVATMGLVMCWPIMLIVALIIRIQLGRPLLFRQTRPGLNCVPFELIKFRSMTNERDAHGRLLPEKERLTSLGVFLRRSSLDELPQLVNVLRGELNLVGPRPLLVNYLPLYTAYQMRRHEVRPGLTGWAQINGRNAISWEEKFAFDVWYVDNRSFLLDLMILLRTVLLVVMGKGIAAIGRVTIDEYRGAGTHIETFF